MPPCPRRVKIDMRGDLWPARGIGGVLGDNSAATAMWRWTCSHVADAAPEWPALLAATTTATLIRGLWADGVLPDGGTLPRLAHAGKNSETACSRVTDESVRVPPRVPYLPHFGSPHFGSLKRCLNPESSDFRLGLAIALGRCRPSLGEGGSLGIRVVLAQKCTASLRVSTQ